MHFFFEIKKSAFITYQPSCKQEPSEVYKLVGVIRVFGLLVRLIAIMFWRSTRSKILKKNYFRNCGSVRNYSLGDSPASSSLCKKYLSILII